MSSEQFGYRGPASETSGGAPFNEMTFVVGQILASVSTAKLVKVVSVTNAGDLSPVGFVDVQPLVNQLDGFDNAVDHGVVHNLPYFRLQGGSDAVILDPKVGDIGLATIADRDISAVKASRAQSNPGSKRRFDMADGLYHGGFLNGAPTQYVQFTADGINIVSPTKVTVQAPTVEVDATETVSLNAPNILLNGNVSQGGGSNAGTTTWDGDVNITGTLMNNGVHVGSTHTHHENGAGSNTNPPNP